MFLLNNQNAINDSHSPIYIFGEDNALISYISRKMDKIGIEHKIIKDVEKIPNHSTVLVENNIAESFAPKITSKYLNIFSYQTGEENDETILNKKLNGQLRVPFKSQDLNQLVNYASVLNQFNKKIITIEEDNKKNKKMQSLGQLAGTMAHDSKNYLNVCQIAFEGIKKVNKDENKVISNFANKGLVSVSKIDDLASNIYQFLQSDADVYQHLEEINLKSSIEETYLIIKESNLDLDVDFSNSVSSSRIIKLNKTLLNRCIANLITNSMKALKGTSKPKIMIKEKLHPTGYYLIISDNGPGLTKETQEKIFKEPCTTDKSSGSGFGLYQLYQDLQKAGININYERIGYTEFTLRFPLHHLTVIN